MKSSLYLGKIFGVKVLLHFTFVLIFIYFGYYGWDKYHSISMILYLFLIVTITFICVLMHEFGHVLAARRVGIGTRQVLILPIGGMAQINSMPENPKDELFVTICGPLVNLGIVLFLTPFAFLNHSMQELFLLLNQNVGADFIGSFIFNNLLLVIIGLNAGLFIFNLAPAYPMDGGRIFRALLAFRFKYVNATLIAVRTGQTIALVYFLFMATNFIQERYSDQKTVENQSVIMQHDEYAKSKDNDDKISYFEIIKLLVLCGFIGSLGEMEYRMVKRKHEMGGYGISGLSDGRRQTSLTLSNTIAEAVHALITNKITSLTVIHLDNAPAYVSSVLPEELSLQNNQPSHTFQIYPSDSLGHALKMMEILGLKALTIFDTGIIEPKFYLIKNPNA